MELKAFVRETLVQITEGVVEAQEACEKMGAMINPMLSAPKIRNGDKVTFDIEGKHYPVTEVVFSVGLTSYDGDQKKAGIGVFLSSVSMGGAGAKESVQQAVTSVSFSIAVVFPFIKREPEIERRKVATAVLPH